MLREAICFVGLFLPAFFLQGQAYAADCKPLRYLGGISVDFDADGYLRGQALLNNKLESVRFTGSGLNTMKQSTADELGLTPLASAARIYSSTGKISSTYVAVSQFALGPVSGKGVQFQVFDDSLSSAATISFDVLGSYDLDMDFGQGRLNIFSPDHCENSGLYWPVPAVAVVPYEGSMKIPVTIDGHATHAFINSGSTAESMMGLKDATEIFGLTPDSPGMEVYPLPLGRTGYRHVFPSLSFEGVTITNASFIIVPEQLDTMFKEKPTDSLISQGKFQDLRFHTYIGTNVMRRLHIYVSTREHKLYIAPTDPAAAKLLPAPTAALPQAQSSR